MKRLHDVARVSFWTIALVAFVSLSAPRVYQLASPHKTQLCGPFHSTDNFFFFDTGEQNASEKLISLFGSIPASQSVLIFTRNDDRRSPFIGMMIAYLAWPHPVRIVDVLEPKSADLRGSDFPPPAICIFCRVPPPPMFRGCERLGDTVEIFRASRLANR